MAMEGRCIHVFFLKKLRLLASTESFLKLSKFEYSRVSYEFLTGSITIFKVTACNLVNVPKHGVFKSFQCLEFTQIRSK